MTDGTSGANPEQVHLSLPEHEDLDEKSVESLGFGGLLDELGIESTQSTSGNPEEGSERSSRRGGKLSKDSNRAAFGLKRQKEAVSDERATLEHDDSLGSSLSHSQTEEEDHGSNSRFTNDVTLHHVEVNIEDSPDISHDPGGNQLQETRLTSNEKIMEDNEGPTNAGPSLSSVTRQSNRHLHPQRYASFDSNSFMYTNRTSSLAPINETGITEDFGVPVTSSGLYDQNPQNASGSTWKPKPSLKKSETIGTSRYHARPDLIKRGSLPMMRDHPRAPISIDHLFVGTRRADLDEGHTEGELPTGGETITSPTDVQGPVSLKPTYMGIFDREYRKKTSVFGHSSPQIVEISFAFDNELRNTLHNSQLFKNMISDIQVKMLLRFEDTDWRVSKTYGDIYSLHRSLLAARAKAKVKKLAHAYRHDKAGDKFPQLPNAAKLGYHEDEEDKEKIDFGQELASFQKQLTNYLKQLISGYCNTENLCRFLHCSYFSFLEELGPKGWETSVRAARLRQQKTFCTKNWSRSGWLVEKDSYLINLKGNRVESVILVDSAFCVEKLGNNRLRVRNLQITVDYRLSSDQFRKWYETLNRMQSLSEYSQPKIPNKSFAPVRKNTKCMFFIDGYSYFQSIYHALMSAKEEIYITDWWITPTYYLIRKYDPNEEHKMDVRYRLDYVLRQKAQEGVKVYILIYKEIKWAIGLQSKHAKKCLRLLHPNIKVMRHPHMGTLLWAHHEKLVVIDQVIAYVGGIDICLGRWDDMMHRLTDTGGSDALPVDHKVTKTIRSKKEHLFMRMNKESMKRFKSRMGDRARRVSRVKFRGMTRKFKAHFPEALVRQQSQRARAETDTFRQFPDDNLVLISENTAGQSRLRYSQRSQTQQSQMSEFEFEDADDDEDEPPDQYLWVGQDYVNIIIKDHSDVSRPFEMVIDRNTTPRMPWHDVSSVVYGQCARDVARHFIQRWNMIKSVYKTDRWSSLERFYRVKKHKYDFLLPKTTKNVQLSKKHYVEKDAFTATCQVVRSIGSWSGGFGENKCERSIYEAYCNLIDEAQHYIYIENQFFVSATSYGGITLFNEVVKKIEARILKAFRDPAKPKFRVYLVLPLIPGFPGQIGQTGSAVPQKIQNWMYRTLCQGDDSMFRRLTQQNVNVMDYVSICGLRTHGILNDRLVTEIVFIHDKIMIVDDRAAIIGSANINDRSLSGERDSEVAVVFRDEEFIESKMDGKNYTAGRFCWGMRQLLWREHLMATDDNTFPDPVSDEFFKEIWFKAAAKNTKIYEEIFNTVPSDSIHSFNQLKEHLRRPKLADTDKENSETKLTEQVQGTLVLFPTQYLRTEDIGSLNVDIKAFAPERLWC